LVLCIGGIMRELVPDLLEPFKTEEGPADHEQGRDHCRRDGTDQEGRRHEDHLVEQGPLRHRPDHREFAVRGEADHLLGVEGQVVAHHPTRLLDRHLGHGGDVVEQ